MAMIPVQDNTSSSTNSASVDSAISEATSSKPAVETQTPPAQPGKAVETTETTTKTSIDTLPKTATITKKAPEATPPATATEETSTEVPKSTEEVPKTAFKPNYDGMIQGFIDGDLTDEDYAAIEATGLSKENFEFMAQGHKAIQEKNLAELHSYVGGPEQYQALAEFASTDLSDEEISAFNQAIATNNKGIAKIAALGLKALYEEKRGNPPVSRVSGSGSNEVSAQGFSSQQELINAMNSRKYKSDSAYRQEVDSKRAKSKF